MKLVTKLARLVDARNNCIKAGNSEWILRHEIEIERIIRDELPSGSGIDSGVEINFDSSHANRLVFTSSYHAMDEHGYYDGWYDFEIVVTPSLAFGFDVRIKGRFGKYQDLRDYLHELFHIAFSDEAK